VNNCVYGVDEQNCGEHVNIIQMFHADVGHRAFPEVQIFRIGRRPPQKHFNQPINQFIIRSKNMTKRPVGH